MSPLDPIAAVTHADPYPYYAELARRPPHFEPRLGLWILASAAAVEAALQHPACAVRPPQEAVPGALQGSASGSLFGNLLRMNDGARHTALKAVLTQVLEPPGKPAPPCLGSAEPAALDRALFSLPSASVLGLLGVPAALQPNLGLAVSALVAGLSPLAHTAQQRDASAAVLQLRGQLGELLQAEHWEVRQGLLGRLAMAASCAGLEPQAVLDNAIGLLWQTHDACAGLLGNSLVQLARRPALRQQLRDAPQRLDRLVEEVARYDPPVQNSRRYLCADAVLNGVALPAGASLLLVLAAANRDEAANTQAQRFELDRPQRRSWTFGSGVHACPGARIAGQLTASALLQSLDWPESAWAALTQPSYRRSLNARIPQFSPEEHPA